MSMKYDGKLLSLAKHMRKDATCQENHLWYDFLKRYPVRFQRQKTIGNYIVDFYCHAARLAIELDGSQHRSVKGLQMDAERTEELKKNGISILRFSNFDVDTKFVYVCASIDRFVQERMVKDQ